MLKVALKQKLLNNDKIKLQINFQYFGQFYFQKFNEAKNRNEIKIKSGIYAEFRIQFVNIKVKILINQV